MLCDNTPIEAYTLAGRKVWVKREDLSCSAPGPPFSKMRGVIEHIANRPEKVFGVLDTYHSKAGWAVAYACKILRRKCINFYPILKADMPGTLRHAQVESKRLGATLVPLHAHKSAILWYRARKHLEVHHPGAYLMPNALKLLESVTASAREVEASKVQLRRLKPAHVVISISSGTVSAGVLEGLARIGLNPQIWLHKGYYKGGKFLKQYLKECAPSAWGLIDAAQVIDEGYDYKDTAPTGTTAPFPCNPWYDLKAWHWLGQHLTEMPGTVLFWNIGD